MTTVPTAPEIGMLVTFARRDHKFVPYGTGGVIDVVDVIDPASRMFWVLTDSGGVYGWTSFEEWTWTGQKLPRTAETENWYLGHEEVPPKG